jgi:hypothetical protein
MIVARRLCFARSVCSRPAGSTEKMIPASFRISGICSMATPASSTVWKTAAASRTATLREPSGQRVVSQAGEQTSGPVALTTNAISLPRSARICSTRLARAQYRAISQEAPRGRGHASAGHRRQGPQHRDYRQEARSEIGTFTVEGLHLSAPACSRGRFDGEDERAGQKGSLHFGDF